MHKKLIGVLARLSALPAERQEAAANLLQNFVDQEPPIEFSPEEIDQLERVIEELIAGEMVKEFFARAKAERRDQS